MNSDMRAFLDTHWDAAISYNEAMAPHTTFRIGGPADVYIEPRSLEGLRDILVGVHTMSVPYSVVGGGANLLVADAGIRGLVVSTGKLAAARVEGCRLYAEAGCSVQSIAELALRHSLAGLDFAAGLPGSAGGAVYMNARCYTREFADILSRVYYIDTSSGRIVSSAVNRGEWSYKKTPFMGGGRLAGSVICAAEFLLEPGDAAALSARMAELEADRRRKGHFDYPCAGSMFKNDRAFGRPSGQILDELGFRGKRIGGAMVSPKHANIFVNAGSASADDMLRLIDEAQEAALSAFGFELEPEVVFLGMR